MAEAYVIAVNGLDSLDDLEALPSKIARFAQMAINRTARDRRASSAKEIREQVNFLARYLSGAEGRLTVSKMATKGDLEAAITGRDRPTSLARFASNRSPSASRKNGGVSVMVSPGQTKFMPGAFIMELRNNNLGLALRLKEGSRIRNKKQVKAIGAGLYLLYGPAINQVFRGVAEDGMGETADKLQQEFMRLLEL